MPTRAAVARSAADLLEQAPAPSALVGFDGFIDAIIHAVDTRRDMTPGGYTRIRTIAEFAARVGAAAGRSTNIELVLQEERFGGNGPLMAGALARLGSPVTYIGAVGDPTTSMAPVSALSPVLPVHPLFRPFTARCARVIPIAPPAHTDALEFDDGKVMFNHPASIQGVTWQSLKDTLGLDAIRRAAAADIIGVVNWSIMAGVESILHGLCADVLPHLPLLPHGRGRRVSIDLSDPAKRTDADIGALLGLLHHDMSSIPGVSVTLGLNLAEAIRIDAVLGSNAFRAASPHPTGAQLRDAAAGLHDHLELQCVVIHPREGAAAAVAGASAWFDGPFTAHPALSTGAGDHFNAGFVHAQAAGLPLAECLAVGCAVSGAYVRDTESPTLGRVLGFLRQLPEPDRL